MARALLEQAFETGQKNKSDWMSSKSALARPESLHAPALKAPQEAGRRGGESIAR